MGQATTSRCSSGAPARPARTTARPTTLISANCVEIPISVIVRTKDRLELLREAIDSIRANKVRAALTILGVVIGITSIVGMTSLIRGFDETLRDSIRERTATDTQSMGALESETRTINLPTDGDVLGVFYDDFVAAVHGTGRLTCPGDEGRNAVELANAMLLRSAQGGTVTLPLDREQYSEFMDKMLGHELQAV